MLANMKSWFKQARLKRRGKKAIKTKFVNEDGSFEEWNGMSWDEMEEKIENEFRIFKENYIQKVESR